MKEEKKQKRRKRSKNYCTKFFCSRDCRKFTCLLAKRDIKRIFYFYKCVAFTHRSELICKCNKIFCCELLRNKNNNKKKFHFCVLLFFFFLGHFRSFPKHKAYALYSIFQL